MSSAVNLYSTNTPELTISPSTVPSQGKLGSRSIVVVDSSYHRKNDLNAGGADPEVGKLVGKGIAVAVETTFTLFGVLIGLAAVMSYLFATAVTMLIVALATASTSATLITGGAMIGVALAVLFFDHLFSKTTK